MRECVNRSDCLKHEESTLEVVLCDGCLAFEKEKMKDE